MKDLIWKYLNTFHPNVYRKKTKFGLCTTELNNDFSFVKTMKDICNVFCCDEKDASKVLREWIDSKPILDNIPNSTNPDVLIFTKTESVSTF